MFNLLLVGQAADEEAAVAQSDEAVVESLYYGLTARFDVDY